MAPLHPHNHPESIGALANRANSDGSAVSAAECETLQKTPGEANQVFISSR